jgi:hypothetical protein
MEKHLKSVIRFLTSPMREGTRLLSVNHTIFIHFSYNKGREWKPLKRESHKIFNFTHEGGVPGCSALTTPFSSTSPTTRGEKWKPL